MINIDEFQQIRQVGHLIILDTNILLELYRQPANISVDIIKALKEVKNNIYIPYQVLNEYLRNYKIICGDERKKYHKVKKELSSSVNKLEEDIRDKISEYRKHNYTDIQKLQNDLLKKSKEIQEVIDNFEERHKQEIELNSDFLENDKVKEFVDFLSTEERVGKDIPFSEKLSIIQEGQVRFCNLIPPGYKDDEKKGIDKYGDLFIWKSILAIAKEQNKNIIFVCNDVKEDWWEKEKEIPIELRKELQEEFKEINPFLSINFLTLEKFFSYLAEELQLGKSKSALQLSAVDDARDLLGKYSEYIEKQVRELLVTINIEELLDEEFLDYYDEKIYWNIGDVSVEKEDKNIFYYINLDISILADLTYREPGDYPYSAGKVAIALEGKVNLEIEEYATDSTLQFFDIKMNDIQHIEPNEWHVIKMMYGGRTAKSLIDSCRRLTTYNDTIKKFNQYFNNIQISSKALEEWQELAGLLQDPTKIMYPTQKVEDDNISE